jgi:hypothetical protein
MEGNGRPDSYIDLPSVLPVFSKSDGKAKTPGKCIDIGILQNRIVVDACCPILVLHVFGGCDMTSAIFMHDNGKLLMQASQNKQMTALVHVMQHPNSDKVQVCCAGVALMVAVCSRKAADSDKLGHMHYAAFSKMIASRAGSFVADRLLPTEELQNFMPCMSIFKQLFGVLWVELLCYPQIGVGICKAAICFPYQCSSSQVHLS